ncbi:MAG: TonB-dependent receptor [Scytonema sp. CRU_2_7]|nr:TonB-dependent receptor [Scytonema sp. CRU_2_7]
MKATPMDGLTASAGFGFTDAEFSNYTNPFTLQNYNGKKVPYAPNFTYNLALQYRARIGLFARVELQGLGTTFFNEANNLKQGSFAQLNARLGYEFENSGIYFLLITLPMLRI